MPTEADGSWLMAFGSFLLWHETMKKSRLRRKKQHLMAKAAEV